jgi:hypothetical protein
MTASRCDTPHYLRFARALALVTLAASASGCDQVRARIGCEHCHCAWVPWSVGQPVSCDWVDPACCAPVEGPLPPPDLPAT